MTQPQRGWGNLPGRAGVSIVTGSALAGLLLTVLTGHGPGLILAVFLASGTMAASLGVRRGSVHLIIPVPALAYLAATLIAGFWHDPAALDSSTALSLNVLQWVAGGFTGMIVATFIVLIMTLGRRPKRRPLRQAS